MLGYTILDYTILYCNRPSGLRRDSGEVHDGARAEGAAYHILYTTYYILPPTTS